MDALIVSQNLFLKYKKFLALDDISFSLERGKIYGLLGRNGAGKTSLLSLLASFREPTSGKILVGEEEPFENATVMEQICFMYEKDYKEETAKVKEYLEVAERYRPYYDKDYAQYLVKRFKLPMKKAIKSLSKGMQSALNVSIGLASRCPVTILDEVYLGMDAPTREIFYQELLADQERHPRTFIISTHLVSEMDYLFDEILILHKGKLLLQEDYESFVSRGVTVTGSAEQVDSLVQGLEKLNEQRLGNTKSVTIYGSLGERQLEDARQRGLQIGNVSLQDLFIYLTKEDEA
ncbi:ABC-type multidrug transport system, ATPase component [Desulfitobacterium dichloroeliminans LMG P-21439]|uniref:ABC-type multidrug transport system, ATPase component n=1 Tax=Desulfitobacterium dichloroeliminans (strain LMG P-21439 / DCA1) TaxID=871963 RepID=L0F1V7_DESDL|nr:ABC transporter ATP-binding protein [Desulfitobacterium dichloroeliminans]AGA67844.1 ABC-type multidrug transport system, ATPase component [Desulfitobacterium dichloroeliminans LMG P-21439]